MTRWPIVSLGDFMTLRNPDVDVHPGTTYQFAGVYCFGRGLLKGEKRTGLETSYKRLTTLNQGDFVYPKLMAWEGAFAVVPAEFEGLVVSTEFPVFTINRSLVHPSYIESYFRMPSVWSAIAGSSPGTNVRRRRLNPSEFLCCKIPLPTIDEQQILVAKIDELASRIHEARKLKERIISNTGEMRGAFLRRLFLEGASSGWRTGYLGEYVTNGCYGTSDKTCEDSSGTPILRMGNIQDGILVTSELKYLHLSPKERADLVLKQGDILVNRTNSAELVGKCAVFDLDQDYGFASYIIRLRINQEKANPYLIAEYINSPLGREYMFSEKKQMTGQANVNMATLRGLPISIGSGRAIRAHLRP